MAPQSSLGEQDVKTLNETRQRLQQLTAGLASLQKSLVQSDPLPSWSVLQNQASIISGYLDGVSSHLIANEDILSSLNAYPLPSFPGHSQQGLLDQLLRKRVEPGVEDWLDRGRDNARSTFGAGQEALTAEELRVIWDWAPPFASKEGRKIHYGGDYTRAEVESGVDNVVTGLRRRLDDNVPELPKEDEYGQTMDDEEEDEEDEEEDNDIDEMQVVGVRRKSNAPGIELDIAAGSDHIPSKPISPSMPIGDVYRFMMTGTSPASVQGP